MRSFFRYFGLFLLSCGILTAHIWARTPVLVELFTSQGCPSCPAAERILAELEASQPIAGAEIITLAWHVDYWDSGGWKDEFASPVFSQRQVAYSRALNIGETYTPQMFVDGVTHFVGTKLDKATKAIAQAARKPKPEIEFSFDGDKVKIRIPLLPKHEAATVFAAVVEDDLSREIERGNNAGKTLAHSSVARDLRAVGAVLPAAQSFETEIYPQMRPEWKKENLKLIVFVQENGSRKIRAVSRAALKV